MRDRQTTNQTSTNHIKKIQSQNSNNAHQHRPQIQPIHPNADSTDKQRNDNSTALIALIEYIQNYKNYTKSTKIITTWSFKKNTNVISSSHLLAVLAWQSQLLFAIEFVNFVEFELFD